MGRNSTGIFAGGALSACLVTGMVLMDHVGMAAGVLLLGMLVITAALAMGATLAFALNAWSRVRHLERMLAESTRAGRGPADGG